jgi:hypothetical protein
MPSKPSCVAVAVEEVEPELEEELDEELEEELEDLLEPQPAMSTVAQASSRAHRPRAFMRREP